MLHPLVTYTAALALLIQITASPTPKSAEKVPPPCTVSGRVVTAAEGTPLKSSRVVLIAEHRQRESQVYAATSDSDGRFIIKDVPAGRYRFLATRTGYVDQHYQANGDDTGAVLALQAGQEVKDILFRMNLAAVFTGRVNEEDGEPMALIQVVALRKPTDEEMEDRKDSPSRGLELVPAGMAQTDDRGQYRIFGLKAGEYYIKAVDQYEPMFNMALGSEFEMREALGTQYAPVYYPGVTQIGQAEALSASRGEEAHVDLVLRRIKTIQISGRIIGADGKPATDAYVYLEELAEAYGVLQGIEVDAKGEFKVRGVAPGSYVLHAQQHSPEEANYHASQKIEVGSDNIDSITLALGRGVNFSGRVTVSGAGTVELERFSISLRSHDSETAGSWARVKKDGTFQLLDVPDGNFSFSISGLEESWYVKSVRLGTDDVLTTGLEVAKGESEGTIQVAVSNSGAELTGSVMQDDKPMIGARVRITPDPETPYNRFRSRTANTDQGGRFSFIGIAPGQYRVIAKVSGTDPGHAFASEPKRVSLWERDHKSIDLMVASPQTQ
jgi:protocatechuate 3,4-dioxygenase beta subunit